MTDVEPDGLMPTANASAYASIPITFDEREDILRYLGVGTVGSERTQLSSWRFFFGYGELLYIIQTLSPAGCRRVRFFLDKIGKFELDLANSSDNLDTDKAAVWTHNKNEVADRVELYNYWRSQMAEYLNSRPGRAVRGNGGAITV